MTSKRPTRIAHLVTREGRASSWSSVKADDGTMLIFHYSTQMAEVRDGKLTQVSQGWGSMTDKCGMARLRAGALAEGLAI